MTPLSSAFVAVSVSTVVSVGAMSAFLPVGTITTRTTRRVASSSPSSSDRRTCGLILRATEYHVGSSNPRSVSQVENSVGNSDEWTQILQLLAFTRSSDVDRARSYLDMSGGDLETAASLFFADTSMGDSEEGDDGASASADSAYEYGNEVSNEYRHGDPVVPATPAVHSQAPLPSSQEPSPVDADSSSDAGSIAHPERTSAIQNGSHANFAAAKRNVAQFNRSCYEGNSITPWKSISGDTLLPENSHAAPVAPAVPEETVLPSSQEPPPVDIEAGAEMEAIAHVDTESIAHQERTSAARRNSRANFAAAKRNVAQFNRSCYEGNSITPWKSISGDTLLPENSHAAPVAPAVPEETALPSSQEPPPVDIEAGAEMEAIAHVDTESIAHQERTSAIQNGSHANFAAAKRNVAQFNRSCYEGNSITPWKSISGDTLLPENSHAAPVAPAVPEETVLPSSQEPPPVDIEAGAEMEAIAHVDTDSEAKTDTDDDAHAKADTRSIAYQERTSAARRNSRANFAAAKRNVAQFNRSCYEGNSITPWKSNSGGSIVATPDSSTSSRKEQKVRGLLMPAADHLSQVDRYGRHRRLQSKPQAHAHADAGSIIHTQQRTRTSQRAFATAKRNVALHRTSSYERNSVTPWTSNAGDGHSNLPTISQPIKAQATSTKPSTPFGDRSSTRYNKGNTVSPWEFKGADEVDEMGDKNRDEEDHENGDEEGDDTHEQQSSSAGTEKIVVSFTDNMPVLFAICSKLIDERSPTATTPSGETASGISKE